MSSTNQMVNIKEFAHNHARKSLTLFAGAGENGHLA